MNKKKKLSTAEKFEIAKKSYENGDFSTIEEAAIAADICPATYYNYAKKTVAEDKKLDFKEIQLPASGLDYSPLEVSKLIEENQKLRSASMEFKDKNSYLQGQVDKLKDKLIDLILGVAKN